jgi:hypothetical protein
VSVGGVWSEPGTKVWFAPIGSVIVVFALEPVVFL